MKRQKEVRKQVTYFAGLLKTAGGSVHVREEIDLAIAYVGLPDRTSLKSVTEAQTKVFQRYGEPCFEIIVYYPEDLRRDSIKSLIDGAEVARA